MEPSVLFVLPNQDFRDEEFNLPAEIFRNNGVMAKITAGEPGECKGVIGTNVSVDIDLDEINSTNYGAILFVGGPGVERYFSNDNVISLAKEFYDAGKLVCAICWAPVILAKAGIISDKRVTAWSGAKNDIETAGAEYTGESVTVDGNLITANGPESAGEFAQIITNTLLGQ